ncbi:MaoC domain protein dehydratase [Methylocella silvestris BL2]|uniref:MaoC domain protein dehydratase n=1 Tax=Methylocella silvestris (strain DSM 15510 / CIP 108128 / LMG 27833 / NCIMB 13906 / BL2) TaxID=395965 RepID=B8EPI5_METSB|nr:MaoC family dehydratase [Methylocella silvestris]ACK50190.1 MaoC domain protein dehydratase [Methylocella silvestris BL2]
MSLPPDASVGDGPKIGDSIGKTEFGPVRAEDLARYALASGDDNPLHLDADVAAAAGLKAPPIHGMLMMSCFEPALQRWRPDLAIARMSAKFLRPVPVGDSIVISGRIVRATSGPEAELLLRLMAHGSNGDLAVLAEATLAPASRPAQL